VMEMLMVEMLMMEMLMSGILQVNQARRSPSQAHHTHLKRGRTIAGGELQILLAPLHSSHSRRDNCLFLCGPATHKGFGTVVHAIGQSAVRIQSGTTMSEHGVREVIPDETRRDARLTEGPALVIGTLLQLLAVASVFTHLRA
jgi:hypothetical protein